MNETPMILALIEVYVSARAAHMKAQAAHRVARDAANLAETKRVDAHRAAAEAERNLMEALDEQAKRRTEVDE